MIPKKAIGSTQWIATTMATTLEELIDVPSSPKIDQQKWDPFSHNIYGVALREKGFTLTFQTI